MYAMTYFYLCNELAFSDIFHVIFISLTQPYDATMSYTTSLFVDTAQGLDIYNTP